MNARVATSTRSSWARPLRAFSLLELMLALAVMGMIAAVGVSFAGGHTGLANTTAKLEAYELSRTLRMARSHAISHVTTVGVQSIRRGRRIEAYQVAIPSLVDGVHEFDEKVSVTWSVPNVSVFPNGALDQSLEALITGDDSVWQVLVPSGTGQPFVTQVR